MEKTIEREKMKTLKNLVVEFGANGFVMINDGNGCGDPAWYDWEEDGVAEDYGDIEMFLTPEIAAAYDAQDDERSLLHEICLINRDYKSDNGLVWASDWIVKGDGDNPWRYRVIF